MDENTRFNTWIDLIEHQAETRGQKPYILYEDSKITFTEFAQATRKVANWLMELGARPGDGIAIMMANCPEFLYLFRGVPRIGMYSVPVNVNLKGEGLRFILQNSDVRYLAIDDVLYPRVAELGELPGQLEKVFVRRTTSEPLPPGTMDLDQWQKASDKRPEHDIDMNAMAYIIYTSGTTGFPKGVVTRHTGLNIQGFMALTNLLVKPDDILYTCLPLFHANALILTSGWALCAGVPFVLDKRFSASRFWDTLRHYGCTQFNAIGAMIPILMKQPERPDDGDNPVRLVISAACPANLWEAFEKRFNVKIWEAYGAVDGPALIINFGNAPIGSVGKPLGNIEWKLVDDEDREVPQGQVGELVVKVPERTDRPVEYYKNPEASERKARGGWVHTGDLFYCDKEGNLYFVDRKEDFIRRRGENISSFEVESVVEKYPGVAECAAFGVRSELGEDEVMIWVKPKAGVQLDLKDLIRYCAANMAYFMVPRYIDVVDEIPRTETLRAIKREMKARGVTERTWDREKEMPDLKLR